MRSRYLYSRARRLVDSKWVRAVRQSRTVAGVERRVRATCSGTMPDLDVNENSDIYYRGGYWNDLDAVERRLNERISGDPETRWYEHFARKTGRSFDRALILNCGNGWVGTRAPRLGPDSRGRGHRLRRGPAARGQGRCRRERAPPALRAGQHQRRGTASDGFDLVVNHAAAHHIAAIDRVFRDLPRPAQEDGWFVSYDYVGPHRNQYGPAAWDAAWCLNGELPSSLRQDLQYPHLPTMLVTDPTEAIHSELIVETMYRYFSVSEFTPLGGALAYPLLTHNTRLFEADDPAERAALGRPHHGGGRPLPGRAPRLDAVRLLRRHAGQVGAGRDRAPLPVGIEESERERRAARAGGEYSRPAARCRA